MLLAALFLQIEITNYLWFLGTLWKITNTILDVKAITLESVLENKISKVVLRVSHPIKIRSRVPEK